MIYITGDCHCNFERFNTANYISMRGKFFHLVELEVMISPVVFWSRRIQSTN